MLEFIRFPRNNRGHGLKSTFSLVFIAVFSFDQAEVIREIGNNHFDDA